MKITLDTDVVVKPLKKASVKVGEVVYSAAKSTGRKSVGTLAIWFPKTYHRYSLSRIKKALNSAYNPNELE